LLIASGSSGGVGVSAAERLSSGIGSIFGVARFDAELGALGVTRTSGVCFVGTRVFGRTRGVVRAATGFADAGRFSPGTWTTFGAGTSARSGPAPNDTAVGGGVWLRWMTRPIQIPPSATSAKVNARSRNSPLDGITRRISV
jgi:hypothetical protein